MDFFLHVENTEFKKAKKKTFKMLIRSFAEVQTVLLSLTSFELLDVFPISSAPNET